MKNNNNNKRLCAWLSDWMGEMVNEKPNDKGAILTFCCSKSITVDHSVHVYKCCCVCECVCFQSPYNFVKPHDCLFFSFFCSIISFTLTIIISFVVYLFFIHDFFPIFIETEHKLVMVGLDNAGKTTILYQFLMNEVVHTSPTIGSNVEEIVWKNIHFLVWDLAGKQWHFSFLFLCI